MKEEQNKKKADALHRSLVLSLSVCSKGTMLDPI